MHRGPMAYGRNTRRVRKLSSRRSSRYGVTKRASSRSRFKKTLRARVKTVTARKRQIKSNTKAIRSLKNAAWGPKQAQTSTLGTASPLYVRNNQPILFQFNNPASGAIGPKIFTCEATNLGNVLDHNQEFQIYQGNDVYANALDGFANYHKDDADHIVNGPKLKLLRVSFQFRFSGFVDDCRIKIQVIRQKKLETDFYTDRNNHNFLPYTLSGFRDLAGWNPNRIDKKSFQIIAEKRCYMNSRGLKSAQDMVATAGLAGATTMDTTHSTTPNKRYINLTVPWNKAVRQLDSSVSETTGVDDTDQPQHEIFHNHGGSYQYTNIHPLANVWVLISCDDTHDSHLSALSQDQVRVECIRTCTWRDPRD